MPIYEYQCKNCGEALEALQGFNDKPLRKCKSCGKNALERLISLSAFHLKGSGWYSTDYGLNSGKSPRAELPSESGTNGAASDSTSDKLPGEKTIASGELDKGTVVPKTSSDGTVKSSKSKDATA